MILDLGRKQRIGSEWDSVAVGCGRCVGSKTLYRERWNYGIEYCGED